jgi:hypothetical protein
LSDENEKKPLRAKFMKILFEETLYKSTGDENERPLREKSVKVLFEETRYKSTGDENAKPLREKKVLSKETQCKSFKG